MTKQIGVSDSVYADLKSLKTGDKDSFSKVIGRLIEGTNRKTKKEEISEEFRRFKCTLSPIINEEERGIIEIMKLFLLKAIDEKDSEDKIRRIYEGIIPVLKQEGVVIDETEMEISEEGRKRVRGIIENMNKNDEANKCT